MRIKPETLICVGNNIFAATSLWQLIKILMSEWPNNLPIPSVISIILALTCFTVSSIMIHGFSIRKQFQIFIQLFCWVMILFLH